MSYLQKHDKAKTLKIMKRQIIFRGKIVVENGTAHKHFLVIKTVLFRAIL